MTFLQTTPTRETFWTISPVGEVAFYFFAAVAIIVFLYGVYDRFARNGATLEGGAKARYAAINERLAELHTAFANNVLADEEGAVAHAEREYVRLSEVEAAADAVAALRERGYVRRVGPVFDPPVIGSSTLAPAASPRAVPVRVGTLPGVPGVRGVPGARPDPHFSAAGLAALLILIKPGLGFVGTHFPLDPKLRQQCFISQAHDLKYKLKPLYTQLRMYPSNNKNALKSPLTVFQDFSCRL